MLGGALTLFLGLAFLLAGCGGKEVVSPTAETVIGPIPTTTTTAAPAGNATAGATLFKSQGCDGCHTFTPAGSTAKVGPDLDKLAQYAKTAGMPLADFTHESIQNPGSYVESGYQNIMPNFGQTLTPQQISDLVAYLTAG
ncbi:MAG TPA: cytochrome c [Gaiellaceae bacterium]|nr:cytochrome c [Gaiellaceae bacterium]